MAEVVQRMTVAENSGEAAGLCSKFKKEEKKIIVEALNGGDFLKKDKKECRIATPHLISNIETQEKPYDAEGKHPARWQSRLFWSSERKKRGGGGGLEPE